MRATPRDRDARLAAHTMGPERCPARGRGLSTHDAPERIHISNRL
jgi:hypothetical protein